MTLTWIFSESLPLLQAAYLLQSVPCFLDVCHDAPCEEGLVPKKNPRIPVKSTPLVSALRTMATAEGLAEAQKKGLLSLFPFSLCHQKDGSSKNKGHEHSCRCIQSVEICCSQDSCYSCYVVLCTTHNVSVPKQPYLEVKTCPQHHR